MLRTRTVLDRDGVEIVDVTCRHPPGRSRHTDRADHPRRVAADPDQSLLDLAGALDRLTDGEDNLH